MTVSALVPPPPVLSRVKTHEGEFASDEAPTDVRPKDKACPTETERVLKTQVLRRIAHDIASPAGVTQTVLDELANATSPRPELIAMARRSLKRLLRLSEQLSLVAELERHDMVPEIEVVDLRAVVRAAVEAATVVDGRRDVQVTTHLPEEHVPVLADPRLLRTTLRELVGNALRMAKSRVEVTVTVRAAGPQVVRVEDDGPGFSAEARELLGQRFVERRNGGGLGLSLSMAMEILGVLGGNLELSTSTLPPGRGVAGAAVVVALPSPVHHDP